jgi:hypothetical protein
MNDLPTRKHATVAMGVMLAALFAGAPEAGRGAARVSILNTPNRGIQPQAAVNAEGTLHLIYFKGDAGAGDIFYVRREPGKEGFSKAMRVNSRPGSAIAVGTIRGGQFALGKNGRVHVAWNASGKLKTDRGMFYTRLNDSGKAFEDQRDLMRASSILDGGGTVAADRSGNVYVAWHALKTGGERGENNRRVWVARSADDGKTFARETPAWEEATGACGCCALHAFADSRGALYLLYRSANAEVNRDIYLLAADKDKSLAGALLHKWKVPS